METVRIRDPGWIKVRSGIRDKHPGSATLIYSYITYTAETSLHLAQQFESAQLFVFLHINKTSVLTQLDNCKKSTLRKILAQDILIITTVLTKQRTIVPRKK